jgi:NTP pyrophosphatase (non-canonical NTP hydrolase)
MPNSLQFGVLREANLARMPQFRNAKGEIAHSKADGSDWSPAQWLQALVGEIGEYANFRKKVERGDLDLEKDRQLLADELADAMTYLDILAYQNGIDLGEATISKWNRVSIRCGSTIRISVSHWEDLNDLPVPSEVK